MLQGSGQSPLYVLVRFGASSGTGPVPQQLTSTNWPHIKWLPTNRNPGNQLVRGQLIWFAQGAQLANIEHALHINSTSRSSKTLLYVASDVFF